MTRIDLARDRLYSVTYERDEQWAQAEAERQRQADMVQTLINEVRRLGTDQNTNLLEIQRLRAEQAVSPPASPRGQPTPAPLAARELGNRLRFQATRTRGETGVSSCVSVEDLQHGRLMEETDVAAHANAW